METNTHTHTHSHSHCWWFDSYNTSKSSPWLQSTLLDLNEKTNSMLKLIEEDADSFAQRAEMYYKKRPELISMVEDFYRAHRSLAERYDQLKSDRAARVRSPLRHSVSLPLPKEGYEYVFGSVKSFDSFTEATYSSEECAESEVEDPYQEDEPEVDQDEPETEKPFPRGVSYDELMPLKYELDRLREENEIQKNIIKQKEEEKEELVRQLSDSIRELRGKMVAVRESSEVSVPCDEVIKLKDEIEGLKVEYMYQKEQVKKNAEALMLTEKVKVEFEEAKSEVAKLREEMRREKDEEKQKAVKQLKDALKANDEGNQKAIKQLKDALREKDEENQKVSRQLNAVIREKDLERKEAIRQLRDAFVEKDMEKKEAMMQLKDELAGKDEEKREAIRQLSIAIEILREESKLFKKSLVNNSPKKNRVEFQMFKGIHLGKMFNLSSIYQTSVVPL